MMTKMVRVLALAFAMVAVSAQAATTTKAPADSSSGSSGGGGTMSVGDGTTVSSKSKTTVFLGTEYDPTKCVLQFNSLQCKVGKNDECGALNGYPLECVKVGRENGKDKNQCQCRANETDSCQNSTSPDVGGVPQFGDCSNGRQCVDSYGHVPSKLELRICAEKVHCVKEINTTATVKAEICHTCRSCIAQNDANNAKLTDKRRFDCTAICPKEILDSIAKRNKEGVGIADELGSGEDSASGSGEEGSSSGGELNDTSKPAAGSKAGASKSAAVAKLSATAVVGSIVLASLSAAVLL